MRNASNKRGGHPILTVLCYTLPDQIWCWWSTYSCTKAGSVLTILMYSLETIKTSQSWLGSTNQVDAVCFSAECKGQKRCWTSRDDDREEQEEPSQQALGGELQGCRALQSSSSCRKVAGEISFEEAFCELITQTLERKMWSMWIVFTGTGSEGTCRAKFWRGWAGW